MVEVLALHPITPATPPRVVSIDIEAMVQWALARSGNLPWRRDDERELSFDRGLTVRPRHRPLISWAEFYAYAGLRVGGPRLPPHAAMTPQGDAALVIEALKRLPGDVAATIITCARHHIRPAWMVEGKAEAELVLKRCYPKRRGKRRGRPITVKQWSPDPQAICRARDIYTHWHQGLLALAGMLDSRLSGFRINGLTAPPRPWEIALAKSA